MTESVNGVNAELDNYKKDTKELDYIYCCEHFGHCGLSTGMIVLIVLLVLGVLAVGAAAFWFFYRKRKRGGKEKMVEENTESTESTGTF
ncbi:unnamed protein product [Caenorhabditis brenneri]